MSDDAFDIDAFGEEQAAPSAFLDMSDLARGRLERMGGDLGRIVAAFPAAAGEQLARVATPVALRSGGVLHVRCTSASWAQSLTFLQAQLLDQLRAACPGIELRTLRVSVGAHAAPQTTAVDAPAQAPQLPLPPLDAHTDAALSAAAQQISDPALRASVLAAARRSTQRHRHTP